MRRVAALAGVLLVAGCTAPQPSAGQAVEPQVSSTAPPTSAAADDAFSVVATGDVLIHPALTEQAERDGDGERDYRPLFAGVRPAISGADLALCHLEVPLAGPDGPFSGYPSFNAPPEVADALADTGYDACSTASNHTLDQGVDGVTSTLDALDAAGLQHTGSYRTKRESERPLVLDVDGVKVGHVSFTYGFNGIELPEDKPWLSNVLDADQVPAAAQAARDAGAEVVIASVHWGHRASARADRRAAATGQAAARRRQHRPAPRPSCACGAADRTDRPEVGGLRPGQPRRAARGADRRHRGRHRGPVHLPAFGRWLGGAKGGISADVRRPRAADPAARPDRRRRGGRAPGVAAADRRGRAVPRWRAGRVDPARRLSFTV